MKRTNFIIVLSLLVVQLLTLGSYAAEDSYLKNIAIKEEFKENINSLFIQGNFNEIEAIASESREQMTRFEDGHFKIDYVYQGVLLGRDEFSIGDYEQHIEKLKMWEAQYADSITPKIALMNAYRYLAWKHRGNSYYRDVSVEERIGFKKWLGDAYDLLLKCEELDVKDPALYALGIGVLKGLGGIDSKTRIKEQVEKSLKVAPQYYLTYTYAASALLPKWGGEPGEVQEFAASIADRTSDEMYARIAVAVFWDEGGEDFSEFNFSWERLRKGFEDIQSKYKNLYYLSHYAWFASNAKDQALAKILFSKIGNKWDSDMQRTWQNKTQFEKFKQWANTGENFPETKSNVENGRYEGIYETYDDKTQRTTKWLYKDGKLNGNTRSYNADGSLYGSWIYKNGEYVGQGPR